MPEKISKSKEKKADEEDDYANDDDQFEESPRQKIGSQGMVGSGPRSGDSQERDQ